MKSTKSSLWAGIGLVPAAVAAVLFLSGCGQHSHHDSSDAPAGTPPPATAGAVKPYPLDICLVSGEKLGSMGTPVVRVYEGQEVKFCCEGCIEEFENNPAEFLAKLTP